MLTTPETLATIDTARTRPKTLTGHSLRTASGGPRPKARASLAQTGACAVAAEVRPTMAMAHPARQSRPMSWPRVSRLVKSTTRTLSGGADSPRHTGVRCAGRPPSPTVKG
ncbi:hypothetical protein ACFQGX_05805 [Nonomuraea dietziae]|uniref:hypothetical protein n=1 Tax=Nonomuraea dietziae TaxID=65515 RepID=UPI003623BC71